MFDGGLSGLRYRDVVKHLKQSWFVSDWQVAASQEIWYLESGQCYITIPNNPAEMAEEINRALRQAVVDVDEFFTR